MILLGMDTFTDVANRNHLYFGSYNLTNVNISSNSVTKYNYRINSNDYSQIFLETQKH